MSHLEAGLITAGAGDGLQTAVALGEVTDVLPAGEDTGLGELETEGDETDDTPAESHDEDWYQLS